MRRNRARRDLRGDDRNDAPAKISADAIRVAVRRYQHVKRSNAAISETHHVTVAFGLDRADRHIGVHAHAGFDHARHQALMIGSRMKARVHRQHRAAAKQFRSDLLALFIARHRERLDARVALKLPILHWYSGSQRDLDRATGLGCWFSVGPAMLAREKGRLLVARMPRHRLLTETDGPFGTLQGISLYPWDAIQAVRTIASVWGISEDDVDHTLSDNLRNISVAL
jgi:Tat protein secretion system quality control protein TatD with DNase activity